MYLDILDNNLSRLFLVLLRCETLGITCRECLGALVAGTLVSDTKLLAQFIDSAYKSFHAQQGAIRVRSTGQNIHIYFRFSKL